MCSDSNPCALCVWKICISRPPCSKHSRVRLTVFTWDATKWKNMDVRCSADDEAQVGTLCKKLRAIGVRSPARRTRLHQRRREHHLTAIHALARSLRVCHARSQTSRSRIRRTQGTLSQRHRGRYGGNVPPRRTRQRTRLAHHHDRLSCGWFYGIRFTFKVVPRKWNVTARPSRHALRYGSSAESRCTLAQWACS